MYKVFFNDRLICLHDDIARVSEMQNDYVGAFGNDKDLKAQLDTYFGSGSEKNLYLFHDNLDELYNNFRSYFKFIPAAGGIVRNEKQESLFIFRRGRWDLPKGKADKGEKPEQTAIREVEEECNIRGVTITRFIASSHHIYYLEEDIVLKKTNWFEMEYTGKQAPRPCKKEGITDYQWLPDDKIEAIADNTFPAILEVVGIHQEKHE
jgi:8-oxo-dGTP pyrophosphatase MutT (NUDIX family)